MRESVDLFLYTLAILDQMFEEFASRCTLRFMVLEERARRLGLIHKFNTVLFQQVFERLLEAVADEESR